MDRKSHWEPYAKNEMRDTTLTKANICDGVEFIISVIVPHYKHRPEGRLEEAIGSSLSAVRKLRYRSCSQVQVPSVLVGRCKMQNFKKRTIYQWRYRESNPRPPLC